MNALTIFLFIGHWQWIVVGLAVLLLFGGRKIPELMKGLGGGIKEFKKASKEEGCKSKEDEKTEKKK